MLSLIDKLMLISINPDKNKMWASSSYLIHYGLKGAVILLLADMKKIVIKNRVIEIIDQSSTGDQVLDEALKSMKDAGRPIKLSRWVARWSKYSKMLRAGVIYSLECKGILKMEEERVFWVFPVKRYYISNISEYQDVVGKVKDIFIAGNLKGQGDKLSLAALVAVCGMHRALFSRNEIKKYKSTIALLKKGEIFAERNPVLKEVIAAIKYAIAAQTAATTAATIPG